MIIIRAVRAIVFICLISISAFGQTQRPADAVRAIVETEQRFAQTAREHGTREAFLSFLADKAVMFDPGPVNGRELWTKRAPNESLLVWQPTFAAVASACDIGYDTGPWEWRNDRAASRPESFGHFVSIWRRQEDGSWKVVLDYGIDHAAPPEPPKPVAMSYVDDGVNAPMDAKRARKGAQDAQRAFATGAKFDAPSAFAAAADPSIRVYREGMLPALGRDAANLLLAARDSTLNLDSLGGGISHTGDLGYDYGRYTLQQNSVTEQGHYLQIWRTNSNGTWKLVLDLQRKLPEERKQ